MVGVLEMCVCVVCEWGGQHLLVTSLFLPALPNYSQLPATKQTRPTQRES